MVMNANNAVFTRVNVDNVIAGGARVSWEMNRHFIDPGTYTFQLQVGSTGLQDADDWADVGTSVIDTYFKIDTEKRTWGKTLDPHYRVKLTTIVDTYYSDTVGCEGHLSKRDWLVAREIVRKENLRHQVLVSPNGYLLKARRYGPPCPDCLDTFTREISKTNCTTCYGTGFEFGYFEAMPSYYVDVGLPSTRAHQEPNRGTVEEGMITGRFIGDPQIYSYDVWINATSDERFYLHTVKAISQVRGVGIIHEVEMRQAPFSDIIYSIPLEGQGAQSTFMGFIPSGILADGVIPRGII